MADDADVVVVGAGLAGLVVTAELVAAGKRVVLVEQEPQASLGGQAHWSFGGLFLVDSPEQRRLGIRDSLELAWQDWLGSAGFDRPEDEWPKKWAQAYVEFAAGEKRSWLHGLGLRLFPLVQWAERGGSLASGPGNSVPRFHVTWGTGPGVLEPFIRRLRFAEEHGLAGVRWRHRVTGLIKDGDAVAGVRGEVLEPSGAERGRPSPRTVVGDFEIRAQAVVVTSGGIGANHELVRRNWPSRMGEPPRHLLSGVPDCVDGRMLETAEAAGGGVINMDRMWHYPEGLANHTPVWNGHGVRVLSGPSPLWLDATGRRLPAPLFPGFDTLGALAHVARSGYSHSWFVLNRRILTKEFALSGSEQNPDLTSRDLLGLLQRRGSVMTGPVGAFVRHGGDVVVRRTLPELVHAMNELVGEELVDSTALEREIVARDDQVLTGLGKDAQVKAVREARRYVGDRLMRVTAPHAILDPDAGPLVAVRLSILTRKTLGGLHTDLSARVLDDVGEPIPGLYAAGEVAGFGGGGMHGYRALEGTFLGGCLFSGRIAGQAAAAAIA
ncbi:FAD-binding dehydrogenase [Phytoactinopolyspora halotolerans]|uniref:FAD-binding dehydrogenase n=1 Tax=Phytoactinopolyspora halotolerans TaxID=1981512 RepID=A0A6L9SGK5_9ACTN|nr:FAD-binding dehydrogenase [Phytoactinopolyspora halotolerans]NEE04406.1 FAD-binding dehydrogenase [Phytoactinopolyspora halotolerans]